MNRVLFRAGVLIFVVLTAATCGRKTSIGKADLDIPPPATAGSLESLVGTAWQFDGQDMILYMDKPPGARAANPKNPKQSLVANWKFQPNGIVLVNIMGSTQAGTWDGQRFVLDGEEGVRVEKR